MRRRYPAHTPDCSINQDLTAIEAVFGPGAMPDCSCGYDDRMSHDLWDKDYAKWQAEHPEESA